MKITTKIWAVYICLLTTQFVSGCASWKPVQMLPPAEARVELKESFISALNEAGDAVGLEIYNESATKYVGTRSIGNNGVIFLYKDLEKSRFAYALLNLPEGTHIESFRKRVANHSQDEWEVKFNGNDAGWATGYTDKEPFFAITTVELNDRHQNTHQSVLMFKSEDNKERFLNALSSLYPHLTF